MRLVWLWTQTDEKERGPRHPILSMAYWLIDYQTSRAADAVVFRLPYPGGNWREEKNRNARLLRLMDLAWRTARVGYKTKRKEKLNKEEEELIDIIAEFL